MKKRLDVTDMFTSRGKLDVTDILFYKKMLSTGWTVLVSFKEYEKKVHVYLTSERENKNLSGS